MRVTIACAMMIATAGCATSTPAISGGNQPSSHHASLGQAVNVDGPIVRPIAVAEDSRCPANARCVWAGRVRLTVDITVGGGTIRREIITGQPLPVADGTLLLNDVAPPRLTQQPILPADYRFSFSFAGGL